MRRLSLMHVLSVFRARPVLPNVRRGKPLLLQFSFERFLVNRLHKATPMATARVRLSANACLCPDSRTISRAAFLRFSM